MKTFMKHCANWAALLIMAVSACEPIEDRMDMGGAITAEQLDVTATLVVVDGKRSNKVVLNNKSPLLSSWDFIIGTTQKKTDTVLLVIEGENEMTFTGLNP